MPRCLRVRPCATHALPALWRDALRRVQAQRTPYAAKTATTERGPPSSTARRQRPPGGTRSVASGPSCRHDAPAKTALVSRYRLSPRPSSLSPVFFQHSRLGPRETGGIEEESLRLGIIVLTGPHPLTQRGASGQPIRAALLHDTRRSTSRSVLPVEAAGSTRTLRAARASSRLAHRP